ncbi:MAG: DegT/DnrJ/EryC1/StrS family aminotransferase [Candidatus Thorarchaeota archaeon]|nr:DegT/DnrJ/EryC1/StrS family aminotransferase [Candidatus Thorarchaeota archaeon]
MRGENTHSIPIAEPRLGPLELEYVRDAIESGWVSSAGPYVRRFQDTFAAHCGSKHALSTCNGTVALSLALAAIDLRPGDEVIVPSFTFMASAATVIHLGARPVFIDSDESCWCMDPNLLERLITKKTKAIMPVHLYGHPCQMDLIQEVAEKHGLYVIEDAAEAHGAEFKGRRVGSIGDIGCFSFYGNKIVTTGEGGMVTTSDDELLERMEMLRNHGMPRDRKYWHPVIGYNFRMTNIQAAIGLAQMTRIDEFIAKKLEIARAYSIAFDEMPTLSYQMTKPWAKNVYWMFSILLESEDKRIRLASHLDKAGIETRPLFIPCNEQPSIHNLYTDVELTPIASRISRIGLSLPSGTTLQRSQQQQVIEAVREWTETAHS